MKIVAVSPMRFSRRVPDELAPNRLARAVAARRAAGAPLLDLTETNPTRVGLVHSPDVLAALSDAAGLVYDPQPFGSPDARAAVAADYARRGLAVDPARILLTASTSEAYAYLLKLLADPGDEVLVPVPSYPLFDHLARLEAVRPVPYALEFDGAWRLDPVALARAVTEATRAVFVVSPNNPTGSYLKRAELDAVAALCAARGLALVGDEVFFDYPLDPPWAPRASVLEARDALVFGLGGLSKAAALPQLKLAWIVVGGPAPLAEAACARLEVIADTYLSVSTPVQIASRALLAAGAAVRRAVQARIATNLSALRRAAARAPACRVLPVEGGWSAIVQVPATRAEEALVVELVEQDGVLVHPGYFFDFPREAFVVLSLLPPPAAFAEGVARLLRRASA
jgi:alanine-synthesizing transaminase